MTVTPSQPDRQALRLPQQRGRRFGILSLLMVAVSIPVYGAAWAVGTFLQLVVFDLDEQESLS